MGRLLEGAGMRDVLPLGKARVPVVKCIYPETGTQVCPPPLPTHTGPRKDLPTRASTILIAGHLTLSALHLAGVMKINLVWQGSPSEVTGLERDTPAVICAPCVVAV